MLKDQGHTAGVISPPKKSLRSKFRKFSGNFKSSPGKKMSSKFFRYLSGVLQDHTKLIMTLAHFQQVKK